MTKKPNETKTEWRYQLILDGESQGKMNTILANRILAEDSSGRPLSYREIFQALIDEEFERHYGASDVS